MDIQQCLDNIKNMEIELYRLRRIDFESKGFQIGNIVSIEGRKDVGMIVALNETCKEKSDEVFVNLIKKDKSLSKNVYSYDLNRLSILYNKYGEYIEQI